MKSLKFSSQTLLFLGLIFFTQSLLAQLKESDKKIIEKVQQCKIDSCGAWVYGGTFNNTFSQTSLTNWASGGQNSVSINSLLSLYANKKIKKTILENQLDLSFGLLKQGKGDSIPFVKSDDKIDFSAKIGREITDKFYYAGLMNFRSQFANGINNPNDKVIISRFMAPAYHLTALGVYYKPKKGFNIFISPLTSKITMVFDQPLADAGAFGVSGIGDPDRDGNPLVRGKNVRYEVGGYIKVAYKDEISKNITLDNNIDLFSNYLSNPQNIDVNWQMLLSMKVNAHISCTFSTHLIYDDDINISIVRPDGTVSKGPRIQFKEVFGAGLSYKFSSLKKGK